MRIRPRTTRPAAASLLLAAASLFSPPAHAAPATMVVTGTATGQSCTGSVVINGVNDSGTSWLFTYSYANASSVGCLAAFGAGLAPGTWTATLGGGSTDGNVTVGAIAAPLTPTLVAIKVCSSSLCYTGTGTAVRT